MPRKPQRLLALTLPAWRAVREDAAALDLRIPPAARLRLGWSARWLSLSWRAQCLEHPELRHATPSFIAGFWRSGTTLLHELMSLDSRWGVLNTDQCMNPATLLRLPRRVGSVVERPMDAMRIAADTPQECEFAALLLGSPSFYRVLLLPESWERQLRFLDPARIGGAERQRWASDLRTLMSLASVQDPRPLLLKSPTHAYRLEWLHELFPGARLVYIVRDPLPALRSNLKLWRNLFALYALSPADEIRLLPRVLDLYTRHVDRVCSALSKWSPSNCAAIRYERLLEGPAELIAPIYQKLGWTYEAGFDARLRAEWNLRKDFPAGTPPLDAQTERSLIDGSREPFARLCARLSDGGFLLGGR